MVLGFLSEIYVGFFPCLCKLLICFFLPILDLLDLDGGISLQNSSPPCHNGEATRQWRFPHCQPNCSLPIKIKNFPIGILFWCDLAHPLASQHTHTTYCHI